MVKQTAADNQASYRAQSRLQLTLARALAEKYGVDASASRDRSAGVSVTRLARPDFWIARMATSAREPVVWRLTALELRDSARVLRAAIAAQDDGVRHLAMLPVAGELGGGNPNAGRWRVYMLLAGLALENLAKSVIVAGQPELVTEEALGQDWPGHGHDLRGLFRRAGLKLSWEELRLVLGLQHYVEWMGRYPVPKRFRRGAPRTYYGVGFRWPDGFSPQREPLVFEALFDRVANLQTGASS